VLFFDFRAIDILAALLIESAQGGIQQFEFFFRLSFIFFFRDWGQLLSFRGDNEAKVRSTRAHICSNHVILHSRDRSLAEEELSKRGI